MMNGWVGELGENKRECRKKVVVLSSRPFLFVSRQHDKQGLLHGVAEGDHARFLTRKNPPATSHEPTDRSDLAGER